MDDGWSLKRLHKLIVTSSTYRQASDAPAESYERDPANRLLARGPRMRVEAEIVRDIALSASGLLNPEVGGPSVHPPAPAFLFQPPASYGPKNWDVDTGGERYRRALYTFMFRSVPYPALEAFDAPPGNAACVRRPRSNTPLQALVTLNEPIFVECARALARRAIAEGGPDPDGRLDRAFRLCLGRSPTDGGAGPPARPPRSPVGAVRRRRGRPDAADRRRAARGHVGRRVRRLDRRRPRPAEPGRDDHQAMSTGAPPMNCQDHLYRGLDPRGVSRRWFLQDCGVGLGAAALASLLGESGYAAPADDPLATEDAAPPGRRRRTSSSCSWPAPRATWSCSTTSRSSPSSTARLPPPELLEGYRAAFINPNSKLLGPKFPFAKHGESGAELSTLLPHLAGVADDLCIVRSMVTDAFNHAPGQILMSTGSQQFGRPSMGAWTCYGLGSESRDLPGYVVFSSGDKGPSGGNANWGSGFLPTVYQGVQFRTGGEPVLYLTNPDGVDRELQRDSLDTINALNRIRLDEAGDPEIATRINAFEMAYRMQASAPDLMDLSSEPEHVLELYGAEPGKPSFANNCLLARRLVERGVRFVQLFHESWDQHGNLVGGLTKNCQVTDRASAALVADLKQRGLLDETLVIWGGEFGRTPMAQGGSDGRDHHPNAFTMWLAGGGTKPGTTHGTTDELGFRVAEDPVHVHDLHATLLHLLGFDHTKLTYRFQGRDFRLTDVFGNVVDGLLA